MGYVTATGPARHWGRGKRRSSRSPSRRSAWDQRRVDSEAGRAFPTLWGTPWYTFSRQTVNRMHIQSLTGTVSVALPDGTGALHLAVVNAHYDVALQLLEHGADPAAAEPGWTPLHRLVWTRRPNRHYNNPAAFPTGTVTDLELARALVAHSADVDARQTAKPRDGYCNMLNRSGATPFVLAAKAVDVEMMRLLLELGADPLLANADGTTALLVAAGVGIWSSSESPGSAEEALEAVKLMIALGDSVTTVDDNGDAALHGAVIRGSPELVLYLLEHGAALDPVNERGWTPLTARDVDSHRRLRDRLPHHHRPLRRVLRHVGALQPRRLRGYRRERRHHDLGVVRVLHGRGT